MFAEPRWRWANVGEPDAIERGGPVPVADKRVRKIWGRGSKP
jgi:hypothetical protein